LSSTRLIRLSAREYPFLQGIDGSPFDTGNEIFGNSAFVKQIAAIISDEAFESRRRWFLRQANTHGWNKTWTYMWQGHVPDLGRNMGCEYSM
jgi:hypothetical protein